MASFPQKLFELGGGAELFAAELEGALGGLNLSVVFGTLPPGTEIKPSEDWFADGVAITGDNEILVWTDLVSWNEDIRTLTMEGSYRNQHLKLRLGIDASVEVVAVDGSSGDVWASQVPRLGTLYPDCPVRRTYFRYVRNSKKQGEGEKTRWNVTFAGREKDLFLAGRPAVDSVFPQACIGIWPSQIVKDWRFYTVVLQGLRDYDVSFWLGRADGTGVRAVKSGAEPHPREKGWVLTLAAADARECIGPRFLEVASKDADVSTCGFFSLLEEEFVPLRNAPHTIALDFGTSNTVVAVETRDALDLASKHRSDPDPSRSKCLVGSKTDWPWVPDRASSYDASTSMKQIPSGIFLNTLNTSAKSSAENLQKIPQGDLSEFFPFIDYALVGPEINFAQDLQQSLRRWATGFKWGKDEKGTILFLKALFVWTMGTLEFAPLRVRACYPFAFGSARRAKYFERLQKASQEVKELTGLDVEIVPALFQKPDGPLHPFIDEAAPLINGAQQSIHFAGVQRKRHFVFAADLGGGTLDVMLAHTPLADAYQIVTVESLELGAQQIVRNLRNRLAFDKTLEDEALQQAYLESLIRRNKIEDLLLGDADLERTVSWKGDRRTEGDSFIASVDLYFFFLFEYCARFLAGSLSQPALWRRVKAAPGLGEVNENELVPGGNIKAEVHCSLSGNGWGFLRLLERENYTVRWQDWFESRVQVLFNANPSLEQNRIEGIDIRWHTVSSAQRKLETAKGILRFPTTVGGGVAHIRRLLPEEAAPNGFVDYDLSRNGTHWGRLVGPGDPEREDLAKAHDEEMRLSNPAFPEKDGTGSWFGLRTRVKSQYDGKWLTPFKRDLANPKESKFLEAVMSAQRDHESGDEGRTLSSIRALMELFVCPIWTPGPESDRG